MVILVTQVFQVILVLVVIAVFRVILVLVGFLVIAEYLAIAESQDTAGFQAIRGSAQVGILVFQVIQALAAIQALQGQVVTLV